MDLEQVSGNWSGVAELWEDPMGDVAQSSGCTASVTDDSVGYTWSHRGEDQRGLLHDGEAGIEFRDSFHQPEPITAKPVPDSRGIANVHYTYMGEWGWRINLCQRQPSGELVIQMTNIAPWGEEARAMRMVFSRD